MATSVVNSRSVKNYDVYIGRPSIFGNPFVIGPDGDREEVIRKFTTYFNGRLLESDFKKQVMALKGLTLGCFCAPEACHGHVIAEWLDANG